jgi:hypothetical protein
LLHNTTIKQSPNVLTLFMFIPTPQGKVCPFLITDRHYLTENLLCLMSNASKYSDRGAQIDVRLQVRSYTTTMLSPLYDHLLNYNPHFCEYSFTSDTK